jgi:hypothetical protein
VIDTCMYCLLSRTDLLLVCDLSELCLLIKPLHACLPYLKVIGLPVLEFLNNLWGLGTEQ